MTALLQLGRALQESRYSFVTVTPETHRRVEERAAARGHAKARSLRDVFGWSRPFGPGVLPAPLFELAERAGVLRREPDGDHRSTVRFSSLRGDLFVHSAYPTTGADAVFFGPDTHKLSDLVVRELSQRPRIGTVVDVGAGSGAVGIIASRWASRVVSVDVNPTALAYTEVNAALAGVDDRLLPTRSDMLREVGGPIDMVISNPPFMADPLHRQYRDGGGERGEGFAVRLVRAALERLAPGGRILVYTGVAIVEGEDGFLAQVQRICSEMDAPYRYTEIDPDIFGEEIERTDAYADADRIAAVELLVERPGR